MGHHHLAAVLALTALACLAAATHPTPPRAETRAYPLALYAGVR